MQLRMIGVILVALCSLLGITNGAAGEDGDRIARIQGGVHYVADEAIYKAAAWWGCNHWMAREPDRALGSQLALEAGKVGTEHDFYARAKFNVNYYSPRTSDTEGDIRWLKEAIARAEMVGQKLVLHTDTHAALEYVEEHGWTCVNRDGETVPVPHNRFHWDPTTHAAAVRDRWKPYIDVIRHNSTVIGYQIGGETWAVESYDPVSLERFRDFLKEEFDLPEIGKRYQNDEMHYADWNEVFPYARGKLDFNEEALKNHTVARYDWARYNKQVHVSVWVEMLKVYNELDGTGRPISYEYNHGPHSGSAYGLYNFDFNTIAERSENFSVGGGIFSAKLPDFLHSSYVKGVGEGPWFTNELGVGSGSVDWLGKPALMRRAIWWNAAIGYDGYHVWTFFNVLGANSEFVGPRNYTPILSENLPSVYFEVEHNNRMIRSLGTLLAESKAPAQRIALLYLEDSSMADLATSYKPYGQSIMHAVSAHGFADQFCILTEYHVDHSLLGTFDALILPRTPRITVTRAKNLASYVAGGGTLLLLGRSASHNDLAVEAPTWPGGPLAEVAGIQGTRLQGEDLKEAPVTVEWEGKPVHVDVTEVLRIPSNSTARAMASHHGSPLATVHCFGRGKCAVLAGNPLVLSDDDPTCELVLALLGKNYAPVAVESPAGIYHGRRVHPEGQLLIMIETADQRQDMRVSLDPVQMGLQEEEVYNVFECFSDERATVSQATDWTFTTQIEPVGVRAYFVTRKKSIDGMIPQDQRVYIDRDNSYQVLASRSAGSKIPSWGHSAHYLSGEALASNRKNRLNTVVTAQEAQPRAPVDLQDGYWGINLQGYTNASLQFMVKDVDYSGMSQFGAVPRERSSKDRLPIASGRGKIGEVPTWSAGQYISLGKLGLHRAEGLRVDAKVKTLHFFHNGIYWLHSSVLGYYQVNYTDHSHVRIPIALWSTLSDQGRPWGIAPKTTVVWESEDAQKRLARYDWQNPFPEREVVSVDIVSTADKKFSVWAISFKE
jgi:hypothetical protein